MIPKIIHYCWFGNNKKTELIEICIETWKQNLSDYEFIEWNEQNVDLLIPFVQEAYYLKKWAFVSDYIRLLKLYEMGGVYLDTDMFIVKNLDELLSSVIFFGTEDKKNISCGIIGAEKKNPFIKMCLDHYKELNITSETNFNTIAIPLIITKIFRDYYEYEKEFTDISSIDNITIYPIDYFYSLPFNKRDDFKNYSKYITQSSYAIHLWNASWYDFNEFYFIRKRKYWKGLKKIFNSIIFEQKLNYQYIRNLLSAFKASISK